MAEYTKEKCYEGMEKMASDTAVALTKIMSLSQEKRKEYAGKPARASDTETDCAIRLKIAAEQVAKVQEDLCK